MSTAALLPMCVRAGRGLLRLRTRLDRRCAPQAAAAADVLRWARFTGSKAGESGERTGTGGLAQAVLQDKLKKHTAQVSPPVERSVRYAPSCQAGGA
ncbi:hypothetical protein NHX12_008224 [Muraenolepis orangiensis]|uniref:Uncharacterized protein n=1 Tax=Muraenolepis orangiensis TaxID=630683 RepID=A0A9Q0DNF9_9TELE|nr:hypothetical protein NHX12_008224 [Muraenolepis orangiensis]